MRHHRNMLQCFMTKIDPSRSTARALLFVAMSVCAAIPAETQQSAPAIIFVHGRGQEGKSINAVRDTFVTAFRRAERAWLGQSIVPNSAIGFVWYADAIDATQERISVAPGCAFAETQTPLDNDIRDDLRDGLMRLATSLGLDDVGIRFFTEDTFRYLSSLRVRCEANARLEMALTSQHLRGRSVVIVAHSMGGIVSLASLQLNSRYINPRDRLQVLRFVTLGTQIGNDIVLKGLFGTYVEPPVPVPATIGSWINFRNSGDMLSFPTRGSFTATDALRIPRDVDINTSGARHSVTSYLASRHVVKAILEPWCRGHAIATKPARCSIVEGNTP